MSFEEILTSVGTGRWTYILFTIGGLSSLRIPPQVFSGAYVAPAVAYTCVPPPNATVAPDQCSFTLGGETLPCRHWDFDNSTFSSTLTEEFALVCDYSSYRVLYSSLYMFGSVFGAVLVGVAADRKGRKWLLTPAICGAAVLPFVVSTASSIHLVMLCRFVLGVCHPILYSIFYTLLMEMIEARRRGVMGTLFGVFWALGMVVWGMMGRQFRDWRYLNAYASLPALLFIPCIWFIDESPRWLILQGRMDDAAKILKKVAKMNGRTLMDDKRLYLVMESVTANKANNGKEAGEGGCQESKLQVFRREMGTLFRGREMTKRTCVMWFIHFVVTVVYFGMSISTSFSDDPFVYMMLGGGIEIPVYMASAPLIKKYGRKYPMAISFGLSGVLLTAICFTLSASPWMSLVLATVGKMAISMAFLIMIVYVQELFPTEARMQGMGSSMLVSRLGGVLSPYVAGTLGSYITWLPLAIFGGSSVVAGAVSLLLPETRGVPLPDTLADLKRGKGTKEDPEKQEDILRELKKWEDTLEKNNEEAGPLVAEKKE